jgi:hypothetical protein
MSYIEDQRKKVIAIRDNVFRDPGGGVYRGKPREFVLQDALLNLWDDIRDDALAYFERYGIVWWADQGNHQPTGHLLSSQVACLNHLYFLRQRKDVATEILKAIHPGIVEAVKVDDGFVEFEVVGCQNYLGEKSHKRGANATSVDAVMLGKKADGRNVLVLIEWKYTEHYRTENKYIPARANVYDRLLAEPDCPINVDQFEGLYYEPFYQLMRQTLLGWKMVQAGEYGCDEYLHLHVIPAANKKLKELVTSPGLTGDSMSAAWQNVLRESARYCVVSPEEFLLPGKACRDTAAMYAYLKRRYWE